MNKSFINSGSTPSAYVTKNRQRVKQYNDSVYLNNGDEFEIELFNPTQNKVLAKIELNGISIGSGIIVRPGERVFLERYLNVARKFLFETYKVSGSSAEVARAIENNGIVDVKFFSEYVNPFAGMVVTTNWNNFSQPSISQPINYIGYRGTGGMGGMDVNQFFSGAGESLNMTGTLNFNDAGSSTTISSSTGNPTFTTNSINFSDSFPVDNELSLPRTRSFMGGTKKLMKTSLKSKEIETGRIEQGSHSGQTFKTDNTNFNVYPTWKSKWQIVPLSEKSITREDLVLHCTHCGTKRKKDSHKFCPFCGNKF